MRSEFTDFEETMEKYILMHDLITLVGQLSQLH
jgi:hypothetical protein